MSDNTRNLQLPYILPSQAQKHVTHNEAIRMLDALVQLSVEAVGSTQPPPRPKEGERHIIGTGAKGAWRGNDQAIASFVDGSWYYFSPQTGWIAWDRQDKQFLVFEKNKWKQASGNVERVDFLGINAQASKQERLHVKSSNILFSHNGNHQRLKLNKAKKADTASIVFQTASSGRVELGTTGSNDFSVKISANGRDWKEALKIEEASGRVTFPETSSFEDAVIFNNLLTDSGRFVPSSKQHLLTNARPYSPRYIQNFNNSTFEFPVFFIHNNNTYGGHMGILPPIVKKLVSKISNGQGMRYGPEFHLMKISAGTGKKEPIMIERATFYRQTTPKTNIRPEKFTTGFYLYAEKGKAALPRPLGKVHRLMRDDMEITYSTSSVIVKPSDGWVYFEVQLYRSEKLDEPNDLAIYQLPGSIAYLALPRVVAGWTTFGPRSGVIANERMIRF